jgi:hypothetical protein
MQCRFLVKELTTVYSYSVSHIRPLMHQQDSFFYYKSEICTILFSFYFRYAKVGVSLLAAGWTIGALVMCCMDSQKPKQEDEENIMVSNVLWTGAKTPQTSCWLSCGLMTTMTVNEIRTDAHECTWLPWVSSGNEKSTMPSCSSHFVDGRYIFG